MIKKIFYFVCALILVVVYAFVNQKSIKAYSYDYYMLYDEVPTSLYGKNVYYYGYFGEAFFFTVEGEEFDLLKIYPEECHIQDDLANFMGDLTLEYWLYDFIQMVDDIHLKILTHGPDYLLFEFDLIAYINDVADENFNEGSSIGFDEGELQGYFDGYYRGLDDGMQRGYDDGYQEAIDDLEDQYGDEGFWYNKGRVDALKDNEGLLKVIPTALGSIWLVISEFLSFTVLGINVWAILIIISGFGLIILLIKILT